MTNITFVQFQVPQEDKKLLTQISTLDGNASMSATLRRLIRQEAERRGIPLFTSADTQQAESQILTRG
jgi:hypothetical protein